MSLHLFTASVTLCVITSLEPLSQNSHECKLEIRRLMESQNSLKDKSIVASQGLAITKRSMSLAIAKETDAMFSFPTSPDTPGTGNDDVDNLTHIEDTENDAPTTTILMDTTSPILKPDEAFPLLSCAYDTSIDATSIDFCANPSMTEAVLEFGQALSRPTSKTTDPDHSLMFDQPGSIDDLFVGQDQAWIWDWES